MIPEIFASAKFYITRSSWKLAGPAWCWSIKLKVWKAQYPLQEVAL
jgi:hypothetical protein